MEKIEVWSNAKKWQLNWVEDDTNHHPSKGGQGEVRKVRRKFIEESQGYFLKFLRKNHCNNFRERIYMEVAHYETINVLGVPKLIESNCHLYRSKDYEMYLVTEFIEGAQLSPALNTIDAINCITRLCEIIAYIHGKPTPIIHRDIKPSNIILRENNWNDPWLVDFGLSSELGISQESISINQEIGNRFLRLPEFVKGSPLKRDPRSDVTLCVGILFYLLTEEEPRMLLDASELMPHQRSGIKNKLKRHENQLKISSLLHLFDQGFKQSIDQRFQSIEELIERIIDLDISKTKMIGPNVELKSKQILNKMNTHNRKSKVNIMKNLNNISNFIKSVNNDISQEFDNSFQLWQSEQPHPLEFKYVVHLTFVDILNPKVRFESIYSVNHVGNEILIKANEQYIDRFNMDQYDQHYPTLRNKIRDYVISGIHNVLETTE